MNTGKEVAVWNGSPPSLPAFSLVTAMTAPLFGRLFDLKRYDLAFLLVALFPVAGYLIWSRTNSAKAG